MTATDPAVAAAAAELGATLGRLGSGLDRLGKQMTCNTIVFRADERLERRISAFMRRHHVDNRAAAIRHLVEAGLKQEQV